MDKKQKILIADDDPGIVEAITLFREEVGYEVESTLQGVEIQSFKEQPPDLLLLDIWMSGWNGRDICMQLKKDENTRYIPIILFSANKDTPRIAREAGADDFILKPFDLDDLLEKIEAHL